MYVFINQCLKKDIDVLKTIASETVNQQNGPNRKSKTLVYDKQEEL